MAPHLLSVHISGPYIQRHLTASNGHVATRLEVPCLRTRVSESMAADSLPGEPKSTRRYCESDAACRKPAEACICKHELALRHSEAPKIRVPTAPGPASQYESWNGNDSATSLLIPFDPCCCVGNYILGYRN